MRALLLVIAVAASVSAQRPARAQAPRLPATTLGYTMSARFDPHTRDIAAREVVRWVNPSDLPLASVPLHLYQNAFSHSETTWMKGATAIRGFDLDALLSRWPDPWGFTQIERLVTAARCEHALAWARGERAAPPAGAEVELVFIQPDDGNPLDRTLGEARLPQPLLPGAELCLAIAFRTRLPRPIARSGAVEGYAHAAQWFPKLGVLDPPGKRGVASYHWAARQFHGETEFYAGFADYDVTLDVPRGFMLAATGEARAEAGAPAGHTRRRFVQRAVHDFAWVAGRQLHRETHNHAPAGGGPAIAISYIVPRGQAAVVPRMRRAAERSFDVLSARVGLYPYRSMTVIHPPWAARATAGMEYPTLVTGIVGLPMWSWPVLSRLRVLESTLVHEIAHNYFYGVLASDEQRDAFLDEGFTSYWEGVIMAELAAGDPNWYRVFGHPVEPTMLVRRSLAAQRGTIDEAVLQTPSNLFRPGTHTTQIYHRPALIWQTAVRRFGQPAVDRLFAAYYARYRFAHPSAEDFLALVEELAAPELAGFLRESFTARRLPDYRVEHAYSEPWQAPLGRIPQPDAAVLVGPEERARHSEAFLGLPAELRRRPDAVLAEIESPGDLLGGERRAGRVSRVWLAAAHRPAPLGQTEIGYHRSEVRLRGPGLRHLPVRVRFEFEDGAVAHDRWDGRGSWRAYRMLHAAPLRAVVLDPDGELAIDADPDNNGLRVTPSARVGAPWARFLAAAAQWLLATVTLWM